MDTHWKRDVLVSELQKTPQDSDNVYCLAVFLGCETDIVSESPFAYLKSPLVVRHLIKIPCWLHVQHALSCFGYITPSCQITSLSLGLDPTHKMEQMDMAQRYNILPTSSNHGCLSMLTYNQMSMMSNFCCSMWHLWIC